MQRSLFVTGSGRSGTSMVTGTLAKSGYFIGKDLYGPRQSNPKGFFEGPVINRINEEILSITLAPLGQDNFEYGQRWLCEVDREIPVRTDTTIDKGIRECLVHTPFCYKDPRFCYTYPIWQPHMPEDHRVICVFRHPAVTVASILKECSDMEYLSSLHMNEARAFRIWCGLYGHVVNRHYNPECWLMIHYDQVLTTEGLDRMETFLGHRVDRSFPDPILQRSRPVSDGAPIEALGLYLKLCELAGYRDDDVLQTVLGEEV